MEGEEGDQRFIQVSWPPNRPTPKPTPQPAPKPTPGPSLPRSPVFKTGSFQNGPLSLLPPSSPPRPPFFTITSSSSSSAVLPSLGDAHRGREGARQEVLLYNGSTRRFQMVDEVVLLRTMPIIGPRTEWVDFPWESLFWALIVLGLFVSRPSRTKNRPGPIGSEVCARLTST